ncbi:TPTE2 [Symbiodinium sp. CCMP2456]|nr:TPTE2 [Symbiodinium sp. CCMP2456]
MLGLHRHGVDILSIESSLRRARIVFNHMDKDAMEPHAKIYRRSRSSPPRTPWWRGSKDQASAAQDEGVPARLLGLSSMEYSIEKLSESLHEELHHFLHTFGTRLVAKEAALAEAADRLSESTSTVVADLRRKFEKALAEERERHARELGRLRQVADHMQQAVKVQHQAVDELTCEFRGRCQEVEDRMQTKLMAEIAELTRRPAVQPLQLSNNSATPGVDKIMPQLRELQWHQTGISTSVSTLQPRLGACEAKLNAQGVVLDSLAKQVGDACKALASLSTKAVAVENLEGLQQKLLAAERRIHASEVSTDCLKNQVQQLRVQPGNGEIPLPAPDIATQSDGMLARQLGLEKIFGDFRRGIQSPKHRRNPSPHNTREAATLKRLPFGVGRPSGRKASDSEEVPYLVAQPKLEGTLGRTQSESLELPFELHSSPSSQQARFTIVEVLHVYDMLTQNLPKIPDKSGSRY